MRNKKYSSFKLASLALLAIAPLMPTTARAAPDPAPDANAGVVYLRTSCNVANSGSGESPAKNCFESLNALNTWIWVTRKPGAANPLLVEMGPGTFRGKIICANQAGLVSFRGAGRGQTVIQEKTETVGALNCGNISFAHLTVNVTDGPLGIYATGTNTTWDNVEVNGNGYVWIDLPSGCGSSGKRSTHYWFGSRIVARTSPGFSIAYANQCDASWFYGSEITAIGSGGGRLEALSVYGGEVHVYGSVIRVLSEGTETFSTFHAAHANGAGEIHIHGTGIDVLSAGANNIVALHGITGGKIHANASSYNLKTASGSKVTRIIKDANPNTHVHAPYLWPEHDAPPNIASVTGADMAVVAPSLTSPTSDGRPHLVIYDATCTTATKWYDTVDRRCLP